MSEPIIISGTTDTGTRYVQFWTEHERIAGRDVTFCRAEMNSGNDEPLLSISCVCPDVWVDLVFDAFAVFRAGGVVTPTHTVAWGFGLATFTPIKDGDRAEIEEKPGQEGLL